MWGIDAEGAANITVRTVTSPSSSMDTNAAILGSGTFGNGQSHRRETGSLPRVARGVVRDNFIHDLQDNFGDPHIDGITVQGGQNYVDRA